jgi:hypothetical protein
MLAEVFILRLEFMRVESMTRGPEFAARLRNPRFVPFSPDGFPHLRERQVREDGNHICPA